MKVQKSYSIEESIYNAFDSLATDRNINKSSFIEEYIRKFLKDNDMDFVGKLYSLKSNPSHIVTVASQDSTYYFLDDGSKIQKILFMLIFKECEAVNPNEFFNKSSKIFENLVDNIKKIDESKVPEFPEVRGSLDKLINMMDESYKNSKEGIEIRREQVELLNEINNNYKSGEYLNKSKIELYEVIIKLMGFNFSFGEKEYELQQLLIVIMKRYILSL